MPHDADQLIVVVDQQRLLRETMCTAIESQRRFTCLAIDDLGNWPPDLDAAQVETIILASHDAGTDLVDRWPFDPTQWYRARIHLQPSGVGSGTVTWGSTMTVGDAVIAQHDSDALPKTSTFPTSVNLFVGAFDTTIAGQTIVEIDDILLE